MTELRWTAPASGGLFELSRRVVGRGEYRGLTFHEVEAKSILNRVQGDRFGFGWTINPYRGCSHACRYCFARPTHDYLGFDIGEDFDTQIVVKVNAVELVRAETSPGRWAGELIAMGTNTDPYQPAEGKYRLTRGVVEVLTERANPFSILTKSTLVLRDLDLFQEAAQRADISVNFSIGTLDADVWRQSEPGTPHPQRRIEGVAKLTEAGVPCRVLIAPVLPGLSDHPDQIAEVEAACRQAGAEAVTTIRLHLRPGVKEHYMGWLADAHPELIDQYEKLYRNRAYLPGSSRRRAPSTRTRPKPAQASLPFG
ncbi:MAG TPA: radical SAM protein [Acidimicrobiia bacterium]|nr:radical SAM protein [Acidimicrobiia bacterium]